MEGYSLSGKINAAKAGGVAIEAKKTRMRVWVGVTDYFKHF